MFLLKIHLPVIVDDTLRAVGSTIGPVSMIVTGMLIAGMNLSGYIYKSKNIRSCISKIVACAGAGTDYSENQWSGYMASTR